MALIKVAFSVLEQLLFAYSEAPVTVRSVQGSSESEGYVVFDIAGPDVPDAPEVTATLITEQNRAGQKLVRMSFHSHASPSAR